MKAAQIKSYGSADNIEIADTDKPVVTDDKVLVKVHAVSLNPFDRMVREGNIAKDPVLEKPLTLGGDFAGEVESVGSGITNFKAGDKVYGTALTVAGGSGALAEFAVVSANNVALMPQNLDYAQAASLPLVGASAVQALYEHMDLQPGQKLFVMGGSGGIGTVAIQIGKHVGAYVAAGIHGGNADELRSLGADEIVDTSTQGLSGLKDFDAVLNLVRGMDFEEFFTMMKPGGVLVSLTGIPEGSEANNKDIKLIAQGTATNTEHLNTLRKLVEAGAVKPVIAETFNLDETKAAYKKLESGGKKGKVVVTID